MSAVKHGVLFGEFDVNQENVEWPLDRVEISRSSWLCDLPYLANVMPASLSLTVQHVALRPARRGQEPSCGSARSGSRPERPARAVMRTTDLVQRLQVARREILFELIAARYERYDAGGYRPARAPRHDPGNERRELSMLNRLLS